MAVLLKGVSLLDRTKKPGKTEQEKKKTQAEKILASSWAKKGKYGVIFIDDGTTSNDYALSGSSSGSGDSSGGSGGSSSDLSNSKNKNKSAMSKSERQKLYKMKDSNVPYYYDHDEDDLMYLAASEKRDYAWGFKEEVFLYTMHDRQKHKYITSFQIDSDAQDICTTCTVDMPYKKELMDYYIPSKTVFMLIGGVYDREVLFIGRVSEIAQTGNLNNTCQ